MDLSVLDNVLVLVYLDSAVAVLIDVCADTQQSVANPLPLAIVVPRGGGGGTPLPPPLPPQLDVGSSGSSAGVGPGCSSGAGVQQTCAASSPTPTPPSVGPPAAPPGSPPSPPSPPPSPPPSLVPPTSLIRSSSSLLMTRWTFLAPNVALDPGQQACLRLHLDLRAVAHSCSDPAVLAGFLQVRRPLLLLPEWGRYCRIVCGGVMPSCLPMVPMWVGPLPAWCRFAEGTHASSLTGGAQVGGATATS